MPSDATKPIPSPAPGPKPSSGAGAHVPPSIRVRGARTHNLKNVSLELPRDKLVEFGCDAGPAVLRQLVRRGLLELVQEEGGEPCYRTAPKFLEVFKLDSLADLPSPHDPPA